MKITKEGWAVLENDTHISRWVEQRGTLENERYVIENLIASRVPLHGSTVIDVGAMIGDHTATYSRLVGPKGMVLAFEPNIDAYECLLYNVFRFENSNVRAFETALGSSFSKATMKRNINVGASYLDAKVDDGVDVVDVIPLDCLLDDMKVPNVSLLKIDAEGYEPHVLAGAVNVLSRYKPAVYYEVHQSGLARNHSSSTHLKDFLRKFGYTKFDILEKCPEDSPQYNVLAT